MGVLSSLPFVDVAAFVVAVVAGLWVGILQARWWDRLTAAAYRHRAQPRRHPWVPATAPIEELAVRARRLGARYHGAPPTQAHARIEGIRQAYDEALLACCAALEIDTLLGVLPPGLELDIERDRVEARLESAGLLLAGRA